jgi:ribosomal protein S6
LLVKLVSLSLSLSRQSSMVFYELFCVSRAKVDLVRAMRNWIHHLNSYSVQDLTRQLMRKAALMVMHGGGVVRKLEQFGETQLAYKMRKDHEWFRLGRSVDQAS